MHWLNKAHHRNNVNNVLDSSSSFIPKIEWHFLMQHLSSGPGVQCRESTTIEVGSGEEQKHLCLNVA